MAFLNDGFTFVLSGRTVLFVTVSAECYPGLISARLCLYEGVILRNFVL